MYARVHAELRRGRARDLRRTRTRGSRCSTRAFDRADAGRAAAPRRSRARAGRRVLLADVRRRLDLQRVLDRADRPMCASATRYDGARARDARAAWVRRYAHADASAPSSRAASTPGSSTRSAALARAASTRCGTTATAVAAIGGSGEVAWRPQADAVAARPRDRARRRGDEASRRRTSRRSAVASAHRSGSPMRVALHVIARGRPRRDPRPPGARRSASSISPSRRSHEAPPRSSSRCS